MSIPAHKVMGDVGKPGQSIKKPVVQTKLVKRHNFNSSCPDVTNLLTQLNKAVLDYGVNNVRVYLQETHVDGYPTTCLSICCYA